MPAPLYNLTFTSPPEGTRAFSAALVAVPRSKLPVVSPLIMVESVATGEDKLPIYNSALPPEVFEESIFAVIIKLVLVELSVFTLISPPTGLMTILPGSGGTLLSSVNEEPVAGV
ncbi:MAG: hypothetical protein BWY32_03605 [bacterium ADurb.Bin243]|nr:MAG: hypothetical protein BWY32_03605 [bacterium ADurb.Bin243]